MYIYIYVYIYTYIYIFIFTRIYTIRSFHIILCYRLYILYLITCFCFENYSMLFITILHYTTLHYTIVH